MAVAMRPTANICIPRQLNDGARSVVQSHPGGVVTLELADSDGDRAVAGMERAQVRLMIDDLALAAGLVPTPPAMPRAAALAGSARVLFERLRELDEKDPDAAAEVVRMIMGHIRSWKPIALTGEP